MGVGVIPAFLYTRDVFLVNGVIVEGVSLPFQKDPLDCQGSSSYA